MNDDLLEFDEPEIEEEFLVFIETSIQRIELMNMWRIPYRDFHHIENCLEDLVGELSRYEQRIGYEFPLFREFERRIRTQLNRCDRTKYRVGMGWIPWRERH
jgi:hypothetical protein